MRRLISMYIGALLVLVSAILFSSCREEPVSPPASPESVQSPSNIHEGFSANDVTGHDPKHPTYDWTIGLQGKPVNKSTAKNGDAIVLTGSGTLSEHRKNASGGGTWVHTDSNGVEKGRGTWDADKLEDFKSYGPPADSLNLPEGYWGGRAKMKILLHPTTTGDSAYDKANLEFDCLFGHFPGNAVEGISLNVHHGPHFKKRVSGSTLFTRHVSYQYFVGGAGKPDNKSIADKRDTIVLRGQGTFNLFTKEATGGGTFQQIARGGAIVATGTWTATKVKDFKSYGVADPSLGLPVGAEGGLARFAVDLLPTGPGATTHPAKLEVECLAGNPPHHAAEGIELKVKDGQNFKKKVIGATLFVHQ